jgi:glutamine amidotransferase
MMKSVTIIDYGLANLFNLETALKVVGAKVSITDDPKEIELAERLILPGVGAFGPGIEMLRSKAMEPSILQFRDTGRPLLGICLGMQFLMEESEENGIHRGLNLIPGRVVKFNPAQTGKNNCKVPQISWNALRENKHSSRPWNEAILRDIPVDTCMYFVHSYYVCPVYDSDTMAYTDYCDQQYSSVISRENVFGVQFHPERSGTDGLKLLSNFLNC